MPRHTLDIRYEHEVDLERERRCAIRRGRRRRWCNEPVCWYLGKLSLASAPTSTGLPVVDDDRPLALKNHLARGYPLVLAQELREIAPERWGACD